MEEACEQGLPKTGQIPRGIVVVNLESYPKLPETKHFCFIAVSQSLFLLLAVCNSVHSKSFLSS
jgi:hypothetical protein